MQRITHTFLTAIYFLLMAGIFIGLIWNVIEQFLEHGVAYGVAIFVFAGFVLWFLETFDP